MEDRDPPVEIHEDLRQVMLERRGKDLTRLDLSDVDLKRTSFDRFTKWPTCDRLPAGFDPVKILERGKYPGLGVKQLHDQGITGIGVHVAIIDQPLLLEHNEYRSKLADYTDIDTGNVGPQMHGPAVASLLVGKTCGVAPDAELHYWAEPTWRRDYQYRCKALEQIIRYNESKEISQRIRIVSVSKGFTLGNPNLEVWKELLEGAEEEGIYVIHCSKSMFGVGCPVDEDADEPSNYRLCAFHQGAVLRELYHEYVSHKLNILFAPVDNRTTACSLGTDAYSFWSRSGLSWGAPYIAGVAALGVQANPNLTVTQIGQLLYESGLDFQKGKLINPLGFVQTARALR